MTSRTALVTGAASGIGAGIARDLVNDGYAVVLVDRDEVGLERRRSELCALPRSRDISTWVVDLSETRSVRELGERLHGIRDLTLVVLNAGIIVPGDVTDLDPAAIDAHLDINLRAPLHLARAAALALAARGGGQIVATVSMGGILPLRGGAVYAATKFGLRGFLAAMAPEVAPDGVIVSGLYPSGVDTPMLEAEARHGGNPLNYLSRPARVDQVVAAFRRAVRTGRLEVYVSYPDSVLSRLAGSLPWLLPRVEPTLARLGERGRRRYLREVSARDAAPGKTAP